jgi:hypothetical protein
MALSRGSSLETLEREHETHVVGKVVGTVVGQVGQVPRSLAWQINGQAFLS